MYVICGKTVGLGVGVGRVKGAQVDSRGDKQDRKEEGKNISLDVGGFTSVGLNTFN